MSKVTKNPLVADRIEALEAENARLRKALKFIAEESNSVDEAWAIAKLALENE